MIHTVPFTGSTNADLAARLAAGERIAEGDWLVADRQGAGRGRRGRAWCDGAGNFMGSTVVHLGSGGPPAESLALVAGLALHATATARLSEAKALLKWPNDLLIDGAKLAGILLERVSDSVVVGIGVNLAVTPELEERRTIALASLGPAPDRDAFADDLAHVFALELERWRAYGLGPVIARWLAAAHPVGTPLRVGEPGAAPLSGAFAGLAEDGALQLRLADGTTRVVHAGEVALAPAD